jgi:hypothetical protein
LIANIKIYNPSPCINDGSDEMKTYEDKIYADKQKYNFYYFANDNDKKIYYYYSIFYKIDTKYFLNPSDQQILKKFDLHQCLIMNSEFEGTDAYKHGKFLRILNEFVSSKTNTSKIICFVNNTKKIVDTLFDFLHEKEIYTPDTPDSDSASTSSSSSQSPTTQQFKFDEEEYKYLKYDDDSVSFYVNQNEDDKHINLILNQLSDFNYTN